MEIIKNHQPLADNEWPIFLDQIRVRNNPKRDPKSRDKIEACRVSLKAHGQLAPILIRPLRPDEKKDDPQHTYELVDGHVRFQSALELGWDCLTVVIQETGPLPADLAPPLDRAPKDYQIPVNALSLVAGLLQSRPEEDGWAGKIMLLILKRKMTEDQVKGLVEWVRLGKNPDTYLASDAPLAKAERRPPVENRVFNPPGDFQPPLPRNVLTVQTPEGYEFRLALSYGGFAEASGN